MKYISTEKINNILKKINSGNKIKRSERFFYQGDTNLLNNDYPYLYTEEEILEYSKCYSDPIYFIEKYCKFNLRSYQLNWIRKYLENRFIIYITSRQVGISQVKSLINLWEMTFHKKNTLLISNKLDTSVEHINKIKKFYLMLPYFLKARVINWSIQNIRFKNSGIEVKTKFNDEEIEKYDNIDFIEAFHIPIRKQKLLIDLLPKITNRKHTRLNIIGQPILGPLYQLSDSNVFCVIRTYWWEVEGRDEKWKEEQIKMIGSREAFDREYNLSFESK